MTNNQTIIIFIATLVYLISIPFVLDAFSEDISGVHQDSGNRGFFSSIGDFSFNVVSSIQEIPIWINTIFIGVPFMMLIVSAVLLLLHG